MTLGFFSRRLALLAAVSSALVLAACGGGSDNGGGGSTNLRAINLTTDLASVDLYTNENKRFSALAPDTVASNVSFEANTYTLAVKRAGEAATLYSDSFALSKDRNYTAVITGRESGLLVRTIPENEDRNNISAGNTRVRVFNLTSDTGGVDVFITTDTTDIGDRQPDLRFTSNSLSDFVERTTGNYRLRVTTVGNPTDVRLDIPLTGLEDKQYHTLVLTSGLGGALVNATLIPQGGNPTILKNTKARVRVAAGADSAGNVSASLGGNTLVGTLRSPSVNAYALVNAGTQDLTVRINGTVVNSGNRTFQPGADYTVLTFGTVAAPQVVMIADDNRLPSTSTRAKIRLVNAVAGSEPMTLQLDFLPLASDVAAGTASGYFTANSSGSARAEVSTLSAAEPLFVATASSNQPLLQAQGVYTVFMLGGATSTSGGTTTQVPTGVLRKDR
jgi:hypothetical protein